MKKLTPAEEHEYDGFSVKQVLIASMRDNRDDHQIIFGKFDQVFKDQADLRERQGRLEERQKREGRISIASFIAGATALIGSVIALIKMIQGAI